MTTSSQVSQWLQFALQQVAAEAYFHELPSNRALRLVETIRRLKYGFNDLLHSYIVDWVAEEARNAGVPNQDADTPYLPGANRMPGVLARKFVERYKILEQFSNNEFGFSATVLQDQTNAQYTLSIKSLEYQNWAEGGDWGRDGFPARAADEIGSKGFAIGQAAAMEEYFRKVPTSAYTGGSARRRTPRHSSPR